MTAVLKAATGPTNSRTLLITCWTASSLVIGFAVVKKRKQDKNQRKKEQLKNKLFHGQEFQVQYTVFCYFGTKNILTLPLSFVVLLLDELQNGGEGSGDEAVFGKQTQCIHRMTKVKGDFHIFSF